MTAQIIYMMNGRGADPAILKGLQATGCVVRESHSVADTLSQLRNPSAKAQHQSMLLVAEVQAGAISLLTLMREKGIEPPPTLLFDQEGDNLQPAIKALQLGVQDYVLASEPPIQRELRARLMAERILSAAMPGVMDNPSVLAGANLPTQAEATHTNDDFRWDPESHIIFVNDKYVRLSSVEGRVFDLLLTRRNHMVSMDELISHGLQRVYPVLDDGIKLLRPHMMRLRNKLERYNCLTHRIVNVRASGYMFI
jgi:DNA-binding response OmpR family regulator